MQRAAFALPKFKTFKEPMMSKSQSTTTPTAPAVAGQRKPKRAAAWFFPIIRQANFASTAEAITALAFSNSAQVFNAKPFDRCLRDDFGNVVLDHIVVGHQSQNCCAVVRDCDGDGVTVWLALMGLKSADSEVALCLGRAWASANAPEGPQVAIGGFH